VTLHRLSTKLGIGYGVEHDIINEELHFWKVWARCVPTILVEELKVKRVIASVSALQRYTEEERAFIDHIVTGNEMWIHHHWWNGSMVILWGQKFLNWHPLLVRCWLLSAGICKNTACGVYEHGRTVDAHIYCATLDHLLEAVQRKQLWHLSK
jgi:hypothetical protein